MTTIDEQRTKIIRRLKEFEAEKQVEIILAVESGSRGWGFASTDSDYDVRFVFKYPTQKYLSLKRPTDSYEWIEGTEDFAGFDIYKFYDLLLKSNMNIIDWVFQDNIYVDKLKNKEKVKKIILEDFDRKKYIAHNYGLCKKNFHKYFIKPAENEPTAKRYIYCIRAILSAIYCAKFNTIAPLNFNDLIKAALTNDEQKEIFEMLEIKKQSGEKKYYKNEKWLNWIESNLSQMLEVESNSKENEYYEELNSFLLLEINATKPKKP